MKILQYDFGFRPILCLIQAYRSRIASIYIRHVAPHNQFLSYQNHCNNIEPAYGLMMMMMMFYDRVRDFLTVIVERFQFHIPEAVFYRFPHTYPYILNKIILNFTFMFRILFFISTSLGKLTSYQRKIKME